MTAAISAGSRCLSRACWRMMSSWRSGSVISRTAWCERRPTAGPATPPRRPAARRRASADAARPWRARPRAAARAASGGGLRWTVSSAQAVQDDGQVGLAGRRRSRRCAPRTWPAAAFSSCVSWRAARSSTASWPRAAARSRADRPRRRRPRSSRRRPPSIPASKSSGISTTAARRRRIAPLAVLAERDDARADERPEQRLEPGALVRVGEGVPRDRGAVDDAAGRDVRAPARDDRVADLVARVELVDDRVGRERRRAEALERGERRGLAGAEAPGQADERDPGLRGQRSGRVGSGLLGLGRSLGLGRPRRASASARPRPRPRARPAPRPRPRRPRPRRLGLGRRLGLRDRDVRLDDGLGGGLVGGGLGLRLGLALGGQLGVLLGQRRARRRRRPRSARAPARRPGRPRRRARRRARTGSGPRRA